MDVGVEELQLCSGKNESERLVRTSYVTSGGDDPSGYRNYEHLARRLGRGFHLSEKIFKETYMRDVRVKWLTREV